MAVFPGKSAGQAYFHGVIISGVFYQSTKGA